MDCNKNPKPNTVDGEHFFLENENIPGVTAKFLQCKVFSSKVDHKKYIKTERKNTYKEKIIISII
jgi:hypothetical protein